jgi:hypothetical protein
VRYLISLILLAACGSAIAADLAAVDRRIEKEPKYAGQPRYCLLVFGRQAKNRVWIVQDKDTLYVDRNGNGDLTEADEKVSAKKSSPGDGDGGRSFEVGELKVGGKTHVGLTVNLSPLKDLAANPNLMAIPHVASAVRKHPSEMTGMISIDVECESLKGGGPAGRVSYMISLFDTRGVFQLARKPADAPIIHLDGPLEVTFYANKPTWTGGRPQDTILCVGTPGHGPGTFAMLKYEDTIPPGKNPTIEATYVPKDPAGKPVKELYELKERC